MLFLISTPIGHLKDITLRALETLQQVDLIFAEDTRRTSILLNHYSIRKPLRPFHLHNEKRASEEILSHLRLGQNLALLSDAGTPLLSDPGETLIPLLIQENLPFTHIPGPAAPITALLLSGFSPLPFQFIGFLPKKQNELRHTLRKALWYPGTTIAFESPERLLATLALLDHHPVVVARELTKIHEECRRGPASALHSHFLAQPPRGEIVLVIKGGQTTQDPPIELVPILQQTFGLSVKEAIQQAALLTHTSRRDLYQKLLAP